MRSNLLAKNIIFNFIGLGAPMLVAVFSIPHLIKDLGTIRFGILTLIWMVISYASLFDLGLGRALTQQLSARLVKEGVNSGAKLVWTSLFSLGGLSIVGAIVLYFFSPWLVQKVLHTPAAFFTDTLHAFYVMALSLPCIIATNSVRGVLESHQEFFMVNVVRLPMGVFTFLGPMIALQFSNSLTFIALFLAFGKIFNFLLYFYFCFRVMPQLKYNICFHKADVAPLFKIGGWTTVSNIVSPLMGYLDRFFIAGISLAAVTYYVTPNEMITKVSLITGSISAVFFPEFAAGFVSDVARVKFLFDRVVKIIFLIIFPIVFTIICFSHQLLQLWLGSGFADKSYRVLQWLACGVLINNLAQIPFCLVQARGNADLTAKVLSLEFPFYSTALWFGAHYGDISVIAIIWFLRMTIDALIMFTLANMFIRISIPKHIVWTSALVFFMIVIGFINSGFYLKLLYFIASLIALCCIEWRFLLSDNERGLIAGYWQRVTLFKKVEV